MCGAATATDATSCLFCNARLATIACPSCFGMMFVGSKFCSHCGSEYERAEESGETPERCPRCRVTMQFVAVGSARLSECVECAGVWAGVSALKKSAPTASSKPRFLVLHH